MAVKQVDIIQSGPSVGDWTIMLDGIDITKMFDTATVVIDRSKRKPQVSIVFNADRINLPQSIEAEVTEVTPDKPKKVKDK